MRSVRRRLNSLRSTLVLIASACSVLVFSAESNADDIRHSSEAVYYADEPLCNVDNGSMDIRGRWGGRSWVFVAPEKIDGSSQGGGLHVRPLDTIGGALARRNDFAITTADEDQEGAVRVRLILALPWAVPQEFGGVDRYTKIAVRMCVKRDGMWRTIRFVTAKGVKGKKEFWHALPQSVRDKDFVESFQLGVEKMLTWVSQNVDAPWISGSVIGDGPTS